MFQRAYTKYYSLIYICLEQTSIYVGTAALPLGYTSLKGRGEIRTHEWQYFLYKDCC